MRDFSARTVATPALIDSTDVTSRFEGQGLAAAGADFFRHLFVSFSISGEATTISKPLRHSLSAIARPMPRLRSGHESNSIEHSVSWESLV